MALLISLTACGGGSGDTAGGGELTVIGTASSGAAIVGQTVDVRCASGSGTTVTGLDGSYAASVLAGKLPCMARVATADGTVLHTAVVSGDSDIAVTNITPATQLLVARLAGEDPAAFFARFDQQAAQAVNGQALLASTQAVTATLKAGGVDFTGVGDLVSSLLRAKTATTPGDAHDRALDALAGAMRAGGTTLAALSAAVANTSERVTRLTTSPTSTVTLPPEMLLRPRAVGCAALRSSRYGMVRQYADPSGFLGTSRMTFDAVTLTEFDNTSGRTKTWVDRGNCRYSTPDGLEDLVVSQAGVLVQRGQTPGSSVGLPVSQTLNPISIGVPQQAHTLADVAGPWNRIGRASLITLAYCNPRIVGCTFFLDYNFTGFIGSTTLDAVGNTVLDTRCMNRATWSVRSEDCITLPYGQSLRAVADGGLGVVDSSGDVAANPILENAFAYRAGNGDMMMLTLDRNSNLELRTRQRSETLPTAGASSSFWHFRLPGGGALLPPVDQSRSTVIALDASSQAWVQTQATPGANDDHPETLLANQPRSGFSFRAAGSALAIEGSTVRLDEATRLDLRGMGVTVYLVPASRQFVVSVAQP